MQGMLYLGRHEHTELKILNNLRGVLNPVRGRPEFMKV